MFRHALPGIDYQKQLVGLMRWLPIVAKRLSKPGKSWGTGFILLLSLVGGCSFAPEKVSLSQTELQQAVNIGFLAPQIRTFDFQPLMVVQVYLDTPSVTVEGEQGMIKFTVNGKLDAEIFGGQVTNELPITISGEAGLTYDTGERAIYMNQVALHETLIDLDIALFRAMILSKFQDTLSRELERIPLISLTQTPELEERLVKLSEEGGIQIKIENEAIIFQHTHP